MLDSSKKALALYASVTLIVSFMTIATTADAFDLRAAKVASPAGSPLGTGLELPALRVDGAGDEDRPPRLIDRLTGVFERIPLRPVKIGQEPRRPDDPEVGIGLVVRIPF
jgi:hypothetical protein